MPDWSSEVCILVAGGASADPDLLAVVRGRCRVAVVNDGYRLAPWADLLYAADAQWWRVHAQELASFAGLKVTSDPGIAKSLGIALIELVPEEDGRVNDLCFDRAGYVGRGGNSGFQLLNLVLQFGCRRLVGLGFDFRGEHWHGKHPSPLRNPRPATLERWAKVFDGAADQMKAVGAEFVNASSCSRLAAYPRLSLNDALARWGV